MTLLEPSMPQDVFTDFLGRTKGSGGHPVLYVLPVHELSDSVEPDTRCLANLSEFHISGLAGLPNRMP